MSDVFSKIWLQHVLSPAMPRFRLMAHLPLASGDEARAKVSEWLDEMSLKLAERGPYVRAEGDS